MELQESCEDAEQDANAHPRSLFTISGAQKSSVEARQENDNYLFTQRPIISPGDADDDPVIELFSRAGLSDHAPLSEDRKSVAHESPSARKKIKEMEEVEEKNSEDEIAMLKHYEDNAFENKKTTVDDENPSLMRRILSIFSPQPKVAQPLDDEQMIVINDLSTCVNFQKAGGDHKVRAWESKKSMWSLTTQTSNSDKGKSYKGGSNSHSLEEYLLLRPDGKFRLCWDAICGILILYQTLMIPFEISFNPNDGFGILDLIDFSLDCFFLTDICLNFNTGYYAKGSLVLNRKKILIFYIKKWFWIDLIASFPYTWLFGLDPNHLGSTENVSVSANLLQIVRFFRFLKVLRLIRVLKLKRIFGKIESYLNMSPALNAILGFLKISLIILIIAHWIACVWHFIGTDELALQPVTWMSKAGVNIVDASWQDRYVTSIYWAVTTMITVGYGDITPVTELEMVVVIFVELVSSGVFAFSMNSINTLITNMDTQSTHFRQTIAAIHKYMKKRHVNKDVQMRVRKYLEYTLDNETTKMDEENLKDLLSENLKQELVAEINGRILMRYQLFMGFSDRFLIELTFLMKEKLCGADERDNVFGEISFFTGMPRIASARSTTFTELYSIGREEFIKLLDQFPEDKEKYFMIKDKITLYNDYSDLNIYCYSCGKKDHIAQKCPEIHYEINHDLLISQYRQVEDRYRHGFKRPPRSVKVHGPYLQSLKHAAQLIQKKYNETHFNLNLRIRDHDDQDSMEISPFKGSVDEKALEDKEGVLGSFNMMIEAKKNMVASTKQMRSKPVQLSLQQNQVEIDVSKYQNNDMMFDQICQYKFYFPHNNFTQVVNEIIKIRKEKMFVKQRSLKSEFFERNAGDIQTNKNLNGENDGNSEEDSDSAIDSLDLSVDYSEWQKRQTADIRRKKYGTVSNYKRDPSRKIY